MPHSRRIRGSLVLLQVEVRGRQSSHGGGKGGDSGVANGGDQVGYNFDSVQDPGDGGWVSISMRDGMGELGDGKGDTGGTGSFWKVGRI